jgi:hypothetical protein
MSGLAEELAADLADLDDEEYEYEEEATVAGAGRAPNGSGGAAKRSQDVEGDEEMSDAEAEVTTGPNTVDAMGVMAGGVRPAEQLDAEAVERMALGTVEDVSKVAKLYSSKRMRDIVNVSPSRVQSKRSADGRTRISTCFRPSQAPPKSYPLMRTPSIRRPSPQIISLLNWKTKL